jgi:hypothetical protein
LKNSTRGKYQNNLNRHNFGYLQGKIPNNHHSMDEYLARFEIQWFAQVPLSQYEATCLSVGE